MISETKARGPIADVAKLAVASHPERDIPPRAVTGRGSTGRNM
jgi:hypothetical protein